MLELIFKKLFVNIFYFYFRYFCSHYFSTTKVSKEREVSRLLSIMTCNAISPTNTWKCLIPFDLYLCRCVNTENKLTVRSTSETCDNLATNSRDCRRTKDKTSTTLSKTSEQKRRLSTHINEIEFHSIKTQQSHRNDVKNNVNSHRRNSSGQEMQSNEQIQIITSDNISILSPPNAVPLGDDAHSSSSSVWFSEAVEDVRVATGRALRLSCKVNARGPVGE